MRSSRPPRVLPPRVRAAFLTLAVLLALPVGVSADGLDPRHFPVPRQLEPNVRFWTDIYTLHSSDHVVIHDNWNLEVVYEVLDFRDLERSGASDAHKRRVRENAVRKAKHKYEAILDDLARGRRKSSSPADRREVEAKLAHLPGGASKYREARSRVRAQTGLANRFHEGIERSGRYMPHLERTFRERGLPVELTRLPFVESMFNDRALSRVGAAGIWQFMPATGRLYMRVNWEADERLDPLLAGEGAARLLADNYRALESWPLALTAYNHGAGGMKRAVRELGTRDMGTIAERYRSRSFGFASRNFYAEFVAAARIYEKRQHYFPGAHPLPSMRYDEFIPDRYVHFESLARRAGVSVAELEQLNPALSERVIRGELLVPKNYRLRIPAGSAAGVARAYASLPSTYKLASQPAHEQFHRVRPGDNLSSIARRYGSSVKTIQQANGLRSAHHIRVGQRLRVPVRGGGFTAPTLPAAPAEAVASAGPGGTYVVRPGDTLSSIARAHGVSLSELGRLNEIARPDLLRVGEKLRIPGAAVAPGGEAATVVVSAGDTLSEIAEEHDTSVQAILAANELSDADLLAVGQSLEVPGSGPATVTHVVRRGDTLIRIATLHGSSVQAIQQANGISHPNRIRPGQELTVPVGGTPVAARATQHVVRRGDTLLSISRRYGTTVEQLRTANRIRGSLIRPDQVLTIP